MKVLTRGIPNFAHIQVQEVEDLQAFVDSHELRISKPAITVETKYIQPVSRKPVMLYIEGTEANRELVERRCFVASQGSMRLLKLTTTDSNTIRTCGTASYVETGEGIWYMLDPRLDHRYPEMWAAFLSSQRELAHLVRIEQEKEDELRRQIDERIDNLGYAEALRRLTGDQA